MVFVAGLSASLLVSSSPGPIFAANPKVARTIIYDKAKLRHAALSTCLLVRGGGWWVTGAVCACTVVVDDLDKKIRELDFWKRSSRDAGLHG
jgi:hypothetical protein